MLKPIFTGLRDAKSGIVRGAKQAAHSRGASTAVEMLGGLSFNSKTARSTQKIATTGKMGPVLKDSAAMRVGKRRLKYAAATAAGLSVYGAAMSNTKYDKRYSSSGRYGLNPQSSGGYA